MLFVVRVEEYSPYMYFSDLWKWGREKRSWMLFINNFLSPVFPLSLPLLYISPAVNKTNEIVELLVTVQQQGTKEQIKYSNSMREKKIFKHTNN